VSRFGSFDFEMSLSEKSGKRQDCRSRSRRNLFLLELVGTLSDSC